MANQIIGGCGMHHIALKASDFEKSFSMYQALGFEPIVFWGEGEERAVMLDMGDGCRLELFAGGGEAYPVSGKYIHYALRVDDVEAAYNTALQAGFAPHTPPTFGMPPHAAPYEIKMHIAFVTGPDGEEVEFFKEL